VFLPLLCVQKVVERENEYCFDVRRATMIIKEIMCNYSYLCNGNGESKRIQTNFQEVILEIPMLRTSTTQSA